MENKQVIDIRLVKDLMEKLHLDNKSLAGKMEVSVATVKRLLEGADQSRMGAAILVKLAQALGMPTHLLIHKDYC